MKNKNIFTNKKFVVGIATLCCFLWGSAYPAIKAGYTLFNIEPLDIPSKIVFAGYRFIIAGVVLLAFARFYGREIFKIKRDNMIRLFILGIIQTTLQYIFFYIGLANTTGVKGSVMNSTGTFFSVIIAHYLYKNDRLNIQKITACIIGFIGVMIVNFSPDLLKFSFAFKGEGFVIISAVFFSAGAIYGKGLSEKMDVMVITGYSLSIGGVLLTIPGMLFGGRVSHFTPASSSLLIYMALLSSVAFSLWALLLKYNKVGSVAVFNFLIPIFGAILSAIFLGESILELKNIAALALVCLGIWMVNSEKPFLFQRKLDLINGDSKE